jgi:hypothetical protein
MLPQGGACSPTTIVNHMVPTQRFAYPARVTALLDFAESSCLDAGNR